MRKIVDRYGRNETMKPNSYIKLVYKVLQTAAADGILERRSEDRSVPDWFCDLESVGYWIGQLRHSTLRHMPRQAGTRGVYLGAVWRFNRWLAGRRFRMRASVPAGRDSFRLEEREVEFSSVEDLLKTVTDGFAREHEIARVIKTYLMDPIHGGSSVSTMICVYSAIMSYFARNDRPVNVVFSAKNRYAAPGKDGYAVDLTLAELASMLAGASVLERAVFMCKFHRGLDTSTLTDRFNYTVQEQMRSHFGQENHASWDLSLCPVPVRLTRVKTGFAHVGFSSRTP